MINEHPTKCNLCSGDVKYVDSSIVYGRSYGMIYLCQRCVCHVGVHQGTDKAKGILANAEMRYLRKICHNIFDAKWSTVKERSDLYKRLAEKLDIDPNNCHFGYFDKKMLIKSFNILKKL